MPTRWIASSTNGSSRKPIHAYDAQTGDLIDCMVTSPVLNGTSALASEYRSAASK